MVAAAVQYGYGTTRDESRSRSGGVIVGLLPNDDDNCARGSGMDDGRRMGGCHIFGGCFMNRGA